jgi:hypothetical protein
MLITGNQATLQREMVQLVQRSSCIANYNTLLVVPSMALELQQECLLHHSTGQFLGELMQSIPAMG